MPYPKGKKRAEETKRKISKKLKGTKKPIGFGIGHIVSEETRKKIGKANSIKLKGKNGYWLNKIRPNMKGNKNPAWNGGSSFLPYSLDWTKTLRRSIRERDKYICFICKTPQGDRALDVHHIDYNKQNCNPNNLISLCQVCHKKTNYSRDYWKNYFKNIQF